MKEYETILTDMYRCKIEDTGEVLTRIIDFTLPIDPTEKIQYSKEKEIAIKFPERDLKQFLHDFDNWALLLQACREHPHIQSEYQKLMILVKLLT